MLFKKAVLLFYSNVSKKMFTICVFIYPQQTFLSSRRFASGKHSRISKDFMRAGGVDFEECFANLKKSFSRTAKPVSPSSMDLSSF